MRLAFILSLVLMFTFQSTFCQVIEKPETNKLQQESYNFYMSKKKSNQTAGWVLLGTGAALITVGFATLNSTENADSLLEGAKRSFGGGFLIIGGGGLTVASIPFFIIANKHKNRANLALKGGSISFDNISIPKTNYLVLSLNISLDN